MKVSTLVFLYYLASLSLPSVCVQTLAHNKKEKEKQEKIEKYFKLDLLANVIVTSENTSLSLNYINLITSIRILMELISFILFNLIALDL